MIFGQGGDQSHVYQGRPRRHRPRLTLRKRVRATGEGSISPWGVSFPSGHPYRVVWLTLKECFITGSLNGGRVAPLTGDLTDHHVGSLRIITLSNFWDHANRDYAMTTRLAPVSAGLTRIENSLVHEGAIESEDYDPEEVEHVWKMTPEQDLELCENNYAGIKSLAYEPGPFSEMTETSVESFLQWYLDQPAEEPDSSQTHAYPFSASA